MAKEYEIYFKLPYHSRTVSKARDLFLSNTEEIIMWSEALKIGARALISINESSLGFELLECVKLIEAGL